MSKNEKISKSLKVTREKRLSQDVSVFELKIIKNKLSKKRKDNLFRIFLEAKWFYNHILSQENVFDNIDDKIKIVQCKVKDIFEDRELKVLGSQIKQEILKRTQNSIKALCALRKKGLKIGVLKFKNEVNSIPLKQFGTTYNIIKNKVTIQGLGKFRVSGLKQLEGYELSNANLVNKAGDYYLMVTCYKDKETKKIPNESIGLDFGIKNSITFSNGVKINTRIPINNKIKQEHRKLSKKKSRSKNQFKQKIRLQKVYSKVNNKKKNISNKIKGFLRSNYNHIAVQDESIKGWHENWFGKEIQESSIGGIISGIKKISHTFIVDKFYRSTKECYECGKINKIKLSDRVYECSCGYKRDRDIHSARNILKKSYEKSTIVRDFNEVKNDNKIPTEHRKFKPVEIISSNKMFEYFKTFMKDVVNETGSPAYL
jgi:putative transposase